VAEHYRVICPDLRRFGWTEATPVATQAPARRRLLALLDALELDRGRLVGHAWGSIIGFMACIERPERFACYLGRCRAAFRAKTGSMQPSAALFA
jgi:pimeloyl-ACP methyl ester carboxylesterase